MEVQITGLGTPKCIVNGVLSAKFVGFYIDGSSAGMKFELHVTDRPTLVQKVETTILGHTKTTVIRPVNVGVGETFYCDEHIDTSVLNGLLVMLGYKKRMTRKIAHIVSKEMIGGV